jgi:DNA-entry nuclease
MKKHIKLRSLLLVICALFSACTITFDTVGESAPELASVQEYNEDAFCVVNGNVPQFSADEITTDSFEEYGDLDPLGRCTVCTASIGKDLMPTEKRGAIGMVKPTGWHTVKYEGIDGNYPYNRCHLIGFQLTGENANTRNLITGTRYMNTEGMLPFENEVAEYVRRTKKHVMYRVTPDFRGRELVARGVQIEAYSVEDKGRGVSFNVYCYNVQPGIEIDYATGESKKLKTATQSASSTYILNTNSKKFHRPSCKLAKDISDKNKKNYSGSREELINRGYKPCGSCKP